MTRFCVLFPLLSSAVCPLSDLLRLTADFVDEILQLFCSFFLFSLFFCLKCVWVPQALLLFVLQMVFAHVHLQKGNIWPNVPSSFLLPKASRSPIFCLSLNFELKF